jgi:hypothetical protein
MATREKEQDMAGHGNDVQQPAAAEQSRAMQQMAEANRIIEDFPVSRYALYLMLFLIQTALCFWISLSIIK